MAEKPTVEQLLRRWIQLRKQGQTPKIENLCKDCPELTDPLRERIEEFRKHARDEHHVQEPPTPSAAHDQATADKPRIEISGYTILREIGHGGQGVIFKALQHATGRHVAVKVLTETRQLKDMERARFEREARVLAALAHPHIVSILDRGHTAGGSAYFTMEYIEGQPLDRWLDDYRHDHPPLDVSSNPGELVRLFMKIADAVNVAHLRGVIHRDLKPSNILVDDKGDPHILDFGLARLGLPAEVYSDQHRIVTMTGQFIGTLPWVSPEQAEGLTSKIDTRTDVYSLGVILYEMLTAEFPYEVVGNMRDVLNNILRARPKPPSTVIQAKLAKQAQKRKRWHQALRNPITPDLEAIVLKALNKKPDDRYQNAGELARDIASYLSGRPTLATEFRGRLGHRSIVWIAPSALVAVILVIVGGVWTRGLLLKREGPPARPPVPDNRLEESAGAHRYAVQSPTQMPPDDAEFYNIVTIFDQVGDIPQSAHRDLDIRRLTIRQYEQYVQFRWETSGNLRMADDVYYGIMLDTDLNPATGQRWASIGAELKMEIHRGTASLIRFDGPANVVGRDGVAMDCKEDGFLLMVERSKIPVARFGLYFESGENQMHDYGMVRDIILQPPRESDGDMGRPVTPVPAVDEDPGFYNAVEILDPLGDVPPGSPPYVDIKKLTVRQYGAYVQFIWEAKGTPPAPRDQAYLIILDTDLDSRTGQLWGGIGGELKISIDNPGAGAAALIYFDKAGNVVCTESGIETIVRDNELYLAFEKSRIPANRFNLYFECGGLTPYFDQGSSREIILQPEGGGIR